MSEAEDERRVAEAISRLNTWAMDGGRGTQRGADVLTVLDHIKGQDFVIRGLSAALDGYVS